MNPELYFSATHTLAIVISIIFVFLSFYFFLKFSACNAGKKMTHTMTHGDLRTYGQTLMVINVLVCRSH